MKRILRSRASAFRGTSFRHPAVHLTSVLLSGVLAACGPSGRAGSTADGAASRQEATAEASADTTQTLAPDVQVRRIAPGLWVHTTVGQAGSFGTVPANGMLLETPDGSVLFDTGWNDEQAEVLLAWAANTLHRPVRRAFVTHSHGDRVGGVGALRRAGVRTEALGLTAELARKEGAALDSVPGLAAGLRRDPAGFELLYPGPGHTRDNTVVYFPAQHTLFGGCLVKADTATTIGNVADADVDAWPRSVARIRATFPEIRTVVPGHGATGGPAALTVTEALVTEKGPAAVQALRAGS
jgi:metallo-beta-lactamase class B